MTDAVCDVAIFGAGPAGAALAAALAPHVSVTLVERHAATAEPRIGESLPPQALQSLKRLGLDETLRNAVHLPYRGVRSIWAEPVVTVQDFLRLPFGPGLHLHRARFEAALVGAATARGVRLLRPTRLASIEREATGWRIALRTGAEPLTLSASLVVDATGRSAAIARRLGAFRTTADRLTAVHAHLTTPGIRQTGFTLLEAAPDGWWYAAPVPDGRTVVAFHTDADLAPLDRMRRGAFRAALSRTTLIAAALAGARVTDSAVRVSAANSTSLVAAAGERWLAVGDAAVAFDPLASQGLFNALTTALLARDAIVADRSGTRGAFANYAKRMREVVNVYRRQLAAHYGDHRRFTDQPFWARRLPPPAASSLQRLQHAPDRPRAT